MLEWENCFFLKPEAAFDEEFEVIWHFFVCWIFKGMQVENLLIRLREYLKAHRMKNDDVLFVIRQDDVDSFINCISNNQISLVESINSQEQGVFHVAGFFFLVMFLFCSRV